MGRRNVWQSKLQQAAYISQTHFSRLMLAECEANASKQEWNDETRILVENIMIFFTTLALIYI
jgi:hypothetical protein